MMQIVVRLWCAAAAYWLPLVCEAFVPTGTTAGATGAVAKDEVKAAVDIGACVRDRATIAVVARVRGET